MTKLQPYKDSIDYLINNQCHGPMDMTNVKHLLVLTTPDCSTKDILGNEVFDNVYKSANDVTESNVDSLAQFTSNDSFETIIGYFSNFSNEQLSQIFQLLKPGGNFLIKTNGKQVSTFSLKVGGFVVKEEDGYLVASKPAYDVGSAVKIQSKGVWSLPTDDLADDDLIDDDELLDEEDKIKPSAESLKVCATTKQRKACANCSCGLREELEQEEITKVRENSQNAKSSCGNCYLGDAFRCASCPYLGLPAFKPGEKVTIDTTSDI